MILNETALDAGENDPSAPLPTTMSFPGIAERQKVNQERSRLREIEIQQRVDPNECVEQFWYNFKETVSKINASLADVLSSSHVTAAQRKEGRRQLDDLNMLILELQQSASQSVAVFLPKADARRANDEVLSLFETLNQAREIICPREKFTFQKYRSARDEQASSSAQREELHRDNNNEDNPGELSSCDTTTHVPFVGENSYGFDNKTNCHLSYDDSTSMLSIKEQDTEEHIIHVNSHDTSTNFHLSNLKNCTVTLKTICGSLKIKNNENCVIYCGPVSGPVFVEHCTNCTIVAASRQLRIHDSTNVHFIIFVASGPIIEDCSQTYFSRLYIPVIQDQLWNNNNATEDFSAIVDRMVSTRLINIPREQKRDSSILHVIDEQNEYQNVKDFKWHKLLQQSPNWSALSDKDTNEFLKQLHIGKK